jgi:hypothetical protein
MSKVIWKPITKAPMDGRPIWTRGNNYGDESKGQHFGWAFWDGMKWVADGVDGAILLYLTHYMEPTDEH